MARKKSTGHRLDCLCGGKAQVFQTGENRYMAHCVSCGSLTFFDNADLLDRLKLVGKLCLHDPPRKPCRGGWTSWCRRCRVRVFFYETDEIPAGSSSGTTKG